MKSHAIIAVLFTFVCVTFVFASPKDGRLDIYWVDVEGGAATFIVTPAGESILIDTGLPGDRDPVRIHKLATQIAGVKKIDHLIITHFDGDHVGGAADVAKLMPVRNVYDHGVEATDRKKPPQAYLDMKCEKRVLVKPGDTIPLWNAGPVPGQSIEVSMTCLAAKQKFIKPTKDHKPNPDGTKALMQERKDLSANADSIVLLLRFGDFDFLDAADLTWNLEGQLVCPVNLVGPVDVFQVDHHGLDSSNNPVLINSVAPTVAVMNNGDRKGCGARTFFNLKNCKSIKAIYQLHKNLRRDGDKNNTADKFIANISKKNECKGHYVKLSVDRAGKTYTVSIPARGHSATYKSK